MEKLIAMAAHLDYVFVLFIRVSGLLISSPIFGRKFVPNSSKIGFCVVLTLVFITGLPAPQTYPIFDNLLVYILICVRELLFGVSMGFVLTTMFNATLTAGNIMDTQIGFSMASLYDAQNNTQIPISGNLFNTMLLITFFAVDGHLKLIEVLYRTIEAVPIGTAVAPAAILWTAAEVMSKAFVLSVMVAMPVLAAGLLMEFALGAIIRTVPQMNMFVIGIPLKIIVGLLIMISSLTLFADFSKTIFSQTFDSIGAMFNSLTAKG